MLTQATFAQASLRRSYLLLLVAGLILLSTILVRYRSNFFTVVVGGEQSVAQPVAIATAAKAAQQFELRIQKNPNNPDNYAGLGLTLLQQVRETGDTTLYGRAGKALDKALQLDASNVDALVGQGVLALALHDFSSALAWADKAWALNPYKAEILGIRVDGQVELRRYEEAVATLQQMVDLRPDLSSYSRISYLRELHGDVVGAIAAMQMAVESTPVGGESWLWTLTHLGNLHFNKGDLAQAESIYQQVLQVRADYPYALAGVARVLGAQGDFAQAIATLQPVSERLPLPEFLTLLGELYEVSGDQKSARAQYDLVAVIQQLNAGAGMNVDLEMALFNANHGADAEATVAQARAAYGARPTIYAADALAWALFKAGNFAEAQKYSNESLRLGTADAMLHFHAGKIAEALGDSTAAKAYLQQAFKINPYFSLIEGVGSVEAG